MVYLVPPLRCSTVSVGFCEVAKREDETLDVPKQTGSIGLAFLVRRALTCILLLPSESPGTSNEDEWPFYEVHLVSSNPGT